jgi:hypothetical protein
VHRQPFKGSFRSGGSEHEPDVWTRRENRTWFEGGCILGILDFGFLKEELRYFVLFG